MDERFTNLFAAMNAIRDGNKVRIGALPSPWECWTLLSLIWRRQRQLWACEVFRGHLADRFVDEDASGRGIVPGWLEWEYFFHGIGCRLTHRVTGEEIETETGEGFDFFFWLMYLRSCKNPDPATKRIVELHHSLESLR